MYVLNDIIGAESEVSNSIIGILRDGHSLHFRKTHFQWGKDISVDVGVHTIESAASSHHS
jgi:hypothetical protein